MATKTYRAPCSRCDGRGGWEGWPGFTCYRCGGSGRDPKKTTTTLIPIGRPHGPTAQEVSDFYCWQKGRDDRAAGVPYRGGSAVPMNQMHFYTIGYGGYGDRR